LKKYPRWMFQIVANNDFDLDVDKCDYLARDAFHCGIKSHIDFEAIFVHASIVNNRLCFDATIAYVIEQVFMTRYEMYKSVYRNPKVIATELLMIPILQKLDAVMDFRKVFSTDEWLNVTDSILNMIPWMAKDDELASLYNRLMRREFPKWVSEYRDIEAHWIKVDVVLGMTSKLGYNPMKNISFLDSAGLTLPSTSAECASELVTYYYIA
jgi:HD superfamily phosphohydrolase